MAFNIQEENKYLDFQINAALQGEEINNYIKQFGWYITPFFFVDQYDRIKYYKDTNTGNKDLITDVMKRTLFDTRFLAIHVEAFYKRLPYIHGFSFLIDHGIILYLQYDYAGAINTLVPIIEGILRNYLRTKGNNAPTFPHLRQSFDTMKSDIIARHTGIYIAEGLTAQDYDPLIAKHDVYLTKWFSFIKDFIDNGMYLNTYAGVPADYLNRHLILHALTNDFYYSFSNVMKAYITLEYLAWIFIELTPGFSTTPNIADDEFANRAVLYSEINRISRSEIFKMKQVLYESHPTFDINKYVG